MYFPASPACHEVPQAAIFTDVTAFKSSSEISIGSRYTLASIERNTALNGVANGTRLFVYLLEHEVFKAALLRHDRVPGDPLLGRLNDVSVKIGNANRLFREDRNLAVAEKKDVARMLQNWRNIGRDKKFTVAQTDNDRRPFANRNDHIRLVDRDDREGENTAKFLHGFSDRHLERQIFRVDIMPDQVSNDLGVGLGVKLVALGLKPLF